MSDTGAMDDDEIWQDLERWNVADFIRPTFTPPTVDVSLPDHLEFTFEQREFIMGLVADVSAGITHELSRKWARDLIDILVVGKWQTPTEDELPDMPDAQPPPA